jgi:thymidylate synthase
MNSKLTKEEFLEKLKTDRDFNNRYGRKHITEGKMVLPPCHYGFQVYTRELSINERRDWCKKNNVVLEHLEAGLENEEDDMRANRVPIRAISLMWNQRSVDTFLGLPFNIASYGLLLEIIAKAVGMVPDELIGNLGDVHLYNNHIEQAKEQIGRELSLEERGEIFKEKGYVVDVWPFNGNWHGEYDGFGIPRRTREPFALPKLWINDLRSDTNSIINDVTKWSHEDFKIENYQSHPTIKAPLSN